ncbi:Hypothetical predicted protein [Mytilus galloprovincialis]|uniref:DUF1758 domain-containing protein n=1 Tax=Mytilus galloprovincialis TaxID=29158 RepID=A0A8B6H9T9_MYTGA|nr:Hypothetical predicted protein [Mytilus galloprovincialis]
MLAVANQRKETNVDYRQSKRKTNLQGPTKLACRALVMNQYKTALNHLLQIDKVKKELVKHCLENWKPNKGKNSQDDIGNEELSAAADNLTKKRNLLESLDSQILDGTELEDMEQEILDADDYAMNMEVAIRRFKDIVSGNKTTPFQQTVSETTYVPIANTLDSSNFPSTNEGSQKSFISEELAAELQLKPNGTSTVSLAAFGDENRNIRNLDIAVIDLQTQNGEKIPMEVLIVPTIAAPLHNRTTYNAANLPYLSGLRLAHPVSDIDKFRISFLIGSDYYWDIVEDTIIRGPGPTAVESKLGYLLSGPMKASAGPTSSSFMLQHKTEKVDLKRFGKIESRGSK